jgi:hypothetical protein
MVSMGFFGLPGRSWLGGLLAAQLMLLVLAWRWEQREVRLFALAGLTLLALLGWAMALRRRRAIQSMPTSRIASAAQGYVELRGIGHPLDVNPLHSPLTGVPCLWFCYQVEHKNGKDEWELLERQTSDTSFVLDDGSGRCLVDPEGAEVLTRHCRRWNDGDYRYEEWTLLRLDPVYVLGNFVTQHPWQGLDARAEVGALLAEWKQDQAGLLRRFDLDHDGRLDEREWALARRLAQGAVERQHRELRALPELHVVRADRSALFLISNHDPDRLARRFLAWAAVHLLAFLGGLAFLARLGGTG